jgi:hypothetical protein
MNVFWLSKLRKGKGEIFSPLSKALLQIRLIRTNRQWYTKISSNTLARRERLSEARGKILGTLVREKYELQSEPIPKVSFFRWFLGGTLLFVCLMVLDLWTQRPAPETIVTPSAPAPTTSNVPSEFETLQYPLKEKPRPEGTELNIQ